MKKSYIIDGNEACARGAYLFSEVCGIYPITPASPMASHIDKWSSKGKLNVFNDTVKVVAAYQRIGNHGYIVDNYNGGGMVVPINEKTGVIEYPAVDKLKNVYYEHPMTHTKIVGFKVPKYKEAVETALKASKVVKEVRYVGWDIAITDKGPVIIEGNEYPGHDIYQLPIHRTNNMGVLPKFEESLGKIEELEKDMKNM